MRVIVLLFFFTQSVLAAVPPTQSLFKKTNKFISSGSIIGGLAQKDLVLIDVRRQYSDKSKTERVVIEMSPAKGQSGRVGFYNLAVEKQRKRLVLDLNGVAASELPLQQIMAVLKKSPLIEDAILTMDPEDRSANLTIQIQKNISAFKVEAFELESAKPAKQNKSQNTAIGSKGRLVIDIAAERI